VQIRHAGYVLCCDIHQHITVRWQLEYLNVGGDDNRREIMRVEWLTGKMIFGIRAAD
jgi:hypothetical protein